MKSRAHFLFFILVAAACFTRLANAQVTFNVIHGFSALAQSGANADGAGPDAGVVTGTDGFYYGVTSGGGAHGSGAIFKVSPDGTVFKTLHSFDALDANGINTEGADPEAPLVAGTDGFLYGTNYEGGPNAQGTIFKISSTGSSFTIIHPFSDTADTGKSFETNADGANPHGSLIFGPGGFLYGTTRYGAANGAGGVFKISTDGGTFAELYSFTDITSTFDLENGFNTDGAFPEAGLLLAKDGFFYGSTNGGGANQTGTIFKLSTNGTSFTLLYTFSDVSSIVRGVNPDGANVLAPLIQGADNNFYGTTNGGGGNGLGTIFKVSADGQTFTTLYTFHAFGATEFNSDGANPKAALAQGADGNFYGTASAGGQNTYGTIFELSADGGSFTTLYSFQQSDGTVPFGTLVTGTGGYFYGTTSDGGVAALGSVFQFKPAPLGSGTFEVTTTAMPPSGGDVGGDGAFVSGSNATVTAQAGDGFVFKNWLVNGAVVSTSTSYTFAVTSDRDLVANFEPTPGATDFEVVHAFTASNGNELTPDGDAPVGGLIKGADGYYYGTASVGGAFASGVIFKMSGDGTIFTTLHSFDVIDGNGDNVEGYQPNAPLVQGTDSYLYGTAYLGGPNGVGTIFKIAPNGTGFSVIHSFSDQDTNADDISVSIDGANPRSGLVQGIDGDFYGTAEFGGTNGTGTVYKVSNNGSTFTTIHAFDTLTYIGATTGSNNNGAFPISGLLLSKDGFFYGTTSGGGLNQNGTIFKVSSTGATYSVLHTFTALDENFANSDGANPAAPLIQGTDSLLYGAAPNGGENASGVIFSLTTGGGNFNPIYTFTELISTGFNSDGSAPKSPLIQLSDGSFYGAATAGGPNSEGTIFQLTTSGSFGLIYSPTGYEGVTILGSLLTGSDGYTYGTASAGGQEGDTGELGTVFRFKPTVAPGGSLQVTISPAAAVTAGAQWQVDGGAAQNSGATVAGLTPGSHTVTFSLVSGFTMPAAQNVNIVANQTATAAGTYVATAQTGSLQVTITPAAAITAGAQWKVDGGALQTSGSSVSGLSVGSHTVSFSAVSGFSTPASQNVNVAANQTATTTGTYVATAQAGSVQVTITPAGAVTAGAQWQVDSGTLENSGSSVGNLAPGSHTITFTTVSGFTTPASQNINVVTGQTTTTTGTYVAAAQTGSVQVTITPAGAVTAGAQWQVDSGALQNSGATVSGLSAGSHTVSFSAASGFTAPGSQNINVVASQTATTTGTYIAISQTGSLQVTLTPAGAITAGAQWQVDSGILQSSGATVANLAPGSHTVNFTAATGFTAPAAQNVNIVASQLAATTGTYTAVGPIVPFTGSYYGLVTGGTGHISITVSTKSRFTGKVVIAGVSQSFKGVFGSTGAFQGVTTSRTSPIAISLQLSGSQAVPGSYFVTGSAGANTFTAYHTAYFKHDVLLEPAKSVLHLTATSADPNIPQVPSKVTLTVGKTGAVHLSGKLPDGTSFSASSTLTGGPSGEQGLIYSIITEKSPAIRGAHGFLAGTVTFPSGVVTGPLHWIKPAQSKGLFPAAIDTYLSFVP